MKKFEECCSLCDKIIDVSEYDENDGFCDECQAEFDKYIFDVDDWYFQ